MSQQNIIMNNKYQWQQQPVVQNKQYTKIVTMTVTAIVFHKQQPKHQEHSKKNKIETMTKS